MESKTTSKLKTALMVRQRPPIDMMDEESKENRNEANEGQKNAAKDVYVYSSLGEEAKIGMLASLFTYFFADLRDLAKRGKLDGEPEALDKIMNLPIKAEDLLSLVDVYMKNAGELREYEQNIVSGIMHVRNNNIQASVAPDHRTIAEFVVFDDDDQDTQCVYLIGVSTAQKRVVVAFRGSVTQKDFIKDAQMVMRDVPVGTFQDLMSKSELVGIHHGFQDYLFGQHEGSSALRASKDHPRKPARRQAMHNRFETIMNHIARLLEQHPECRLFVAGHSLGGALATAFAFFAAESADPRIPRPVTCISIASPKVGNLSFRLATEVRSICDDLVCSTVRFLMKLQQNLERQRKLRILRVANAGDIVPLFPEFSFNCCKRSCMKSWFRHVGMKLFLYPTWKGGYKLSHPTLAKKNICFFFAFGFLRLLKHFVVAIFFFPIILVTSCLAGRVFLNNHGLDEYLRRLNTNMDDLTKLSLNDLYDEYLPAEYNIPNNLSDMEAGED